MKDGFSKLSKEEKIKWVNETFFNSDSESLELIKKYWNEDKSFQKLHDEFAENTLTNFYLPLGVAPNFIIDNKNYTIPIVTEESSVVAAASKAAKYWSTRGGFKSTIINTTKTGQVHFKFNGRSKKINDLFNSIKIKLKDSCKEITKNMNKRGGGIINMKLLDKTKSIKNYYQIAVEFDTVDSMGANFINSCLEQIALSFETEFNESNIFNEGEKLKIIMSILSNYTPKCVVKVELKTKISNLKSKDISDPENFAKKFVEAVEIAEKDISRAVTHNKGIMNGIDAVVIATGNDFRAIEAAIHAYASKDGSYRSLTRAKIENDEFIYRIEIPISVGTVGGIINLHPMVKWCLNLLQQPNSKQLMSIIGAAGLAQNFSAIKSLITTGIQVGHMKMHLINILNSLGADEYEKTKIIEYFKINKVTFNSVKRALKKLRKNEL
ncbi:MAG: hydroxymethylglutaryl-CoA reductase, degradative [Flavobacteriaceae bacterium]|tara:strand:+ start:5920 stop:7233 length:1314 start_codon:yes stop_codon:yes gene_type:complete